MEKIYCVKCNNYRNFKNPKISYIFNEILFLFICNECGSNDITIFKKDESIDNLKILV